MLTLAKLLTVKTTPAAVSGPNGQQKRNDKHRLHLQMLDKTVEELSVREEEVEAFRAVEEDSWVEIEVSVRDGNISLGGGQGSYVGQIVGAAKLLRVLSPDEGRSIKQVLRAGGHVGLAVSTIGVPPVTAKGGEPK